MPESYEEMVAEAKAETEQTNTDAVNNSLQSGEDVTVVDVREQDEWDEGHIPGAKLIPRGLLEYQASEQLPDKEANIVVHCAFGGRGALAAKALKDMGYTNVSNMDGGMNDWIEKGYEIEEG